MSALEVKSQDDVETSLKRKREAHGVSTLQALCVAKLIEMAHHAKLTFPVLRLVESLPILDSEPIKHVKEVCRKVSEDTFPVLVQNHSKEELQALLGEDKYVRLLQELKESEEAKRKLASFRTGTIMAEAKCDSKLYEPDEEGNYSLQVLRAGVEWPKGIPPASREKFLKNDEFKALFNMNKEDFAKLAKYVQIRMKKEHELF